MNFWTLCRGCAALALTGMLWAGACTAQEQSWFKRNKHGNRYEGLVDQPNGLTDYRVIDLVASTDVEPLKDPLHLHIAYFLPPEQRVREFQVRERADETQYLMIPILSPDRPSQWNVFGDWDTRDVIKPNNVRIPNLGVLIRLADRATPEWLVPAVLYGDVAPAALKGYQLHVFIEPALSTLTCTVHTSSGAVAPNTATSGCSISPRPSPGTPSSATIRFSIAAAGLREGDVTVHLAGKFADDASSSRFSHDIHFYHQPHLPAPGAR